MSRALIYLRRGILGVAFAGTLGFGGTQALAGPEGARGKACPRTGGNYLYPPCNIGCPQKQGYCSFEGFCRCGPLP